MCRGMFEVGTVQILSETLLVARAFKRRSESTIYIVLVSEPSPSRFGISGNHPVH